MPTEGGDRLTSGDPPAARARIPMAAWQLTVALFAAVSTANMLTPLLPDVRDEFGITLSAAGLVVGAYGFARLLIDLPFAVLTVRAGRQALATTAVTLTLLGSLLGLVAWNLEALLVARVMAGAGAAIIGIVVLTSMSEVADRANRGRVMSLIHIANNAGIAIYPLIGGLIGLLFGWRTTFLLSAALGVLCFITLLPALRTLEGTRRAAAAEPDADPPALSRRRSAVSLAAIYVGVVANHIHRHGFRNTFVPLYGAAFLGLGTGPIAAAIGLMALFGLIVATPGGIISDRFGRRRVIVLGLVGVAVGDLLYLLTSDVVSFLVAAILVGAMDFFSSSQTALLAEVSSARTRQRTLSGFRFSVDLGAAIGPVVVAAALDSWGPTGAVMLTSAVLGLAAAANAVAINTPPADRVANVALRA